MRSLSEENPADGEKLTEVVEASLQVGEAPDGPVRVQLPPGPLPGLMPGPQEHPQVKQEPHAPRDQHPPLEGHRSHDGTEPN